MDQTLIILYIMLGAVVGMIYGLRRIFILERRILSIDAKVSRLLGKKVMKPTKKTTKKKK
jgi:hypothetical protein